MRPRRLKVPLLLSFLLCAAIAHAQLSFTEYPTPTPFADPTRITNGPDGALWFTESGSNQIGRITTGGAITEIPLANQSAHPSAITTGPDGALWFTESGSSKIGRITTAGAVTEFPITDPAGGITAGPDGALWFYYNVPEVIDSNQAGSVIGRMTTAGVVTEFPLSYAVSQIQGNITTGPDGALWFLFKVICDVCSNAGGRMGRITTAGVITEFPTSLGNFFGGPTVGPDGALWFIATQAEIVRMTTVGVATQYQLNAQASNITKGPDGALWFVENPVLDGLDSTLGRITTTGVGSYYPIKGITNDGSDATDVTTGPDGALWITDGNGKIWRSTVPTSANPVISGPAPPLGQVGANYSASLSAFGGTPPYKNWSVASGTLPQGLGLDSSSGIIGGIPTVAETMSFAVTVQDSAGMTSPPQNLSITINAVIPGLSSIGSMPHVAAEENWMTTFTLVNKGAAPGTARLSLFGDPSGTLPLPLTFPQQGTASSTTASVDKSIAGNASFIVRTAGPQTPPVQVGSAQLSGTGAIDGFAILHHVVTQQETAVPMETRNASSYVLAFDNTAGSVLGVALAGLAAPATIGVVIRDDSGTQIGGESLRLAAGGHASFVLPTQYPVTANKRGTIEFDTTNPGQISVMGMRFTPPNNALTTIPPLANVVPGSGSIAHLASGNGWKTTFVLVNTGSSTAPVQLNFFADNGTPLALPVAFPQTTDGTTSVVSSVTQSLAAGATLLIESEAPLSDPSPTIGSAQLTSSGNVGGFVIFRYDPTGQEAAVPFETRNANAYLLAFDNTAGNATGVAINSVSTQAVSVPVVIRDDAGNQIATDTLALAANGHLAFTLVTDKYPAAANIRGTIEFDAPSGAQISALAFRFLAAHTFTTLPALVK